jgi:hypothetical protein
MANTDNQYLVVCIDKSVVIPKKKISETDIFLIMNLFVFQWVLIVLTF